MSDSPPPPRIGWPRTLIPPHLRRRILAAVLAAAAVLMALVAVHKPAGTVPVTVAAHDLPAGARLAAGDVRVVAVPAAAAPAGVQPGAVSLVGRVLADAVRAREPLTDLRLGQGQLLAGLQPGQVAAPVRLIDPGVTTLLRVGVTVDVLAAGSAPTGSADSTSQPARLVARGARVLAVPPVAGGDAQGTLVVLAVGRSDAQALAGAEAGGRLSVTLVPQE